MDKVTARNERAGAAAAWLVHAFTASGVVFAILALMAVDRQDYGGAFLWLGIALIVDGVDGSLARAARVGERAPRIDGAALDLVIDYLNYVFVPAIIIWKAELVPSALVLPLAAAILVSSLYNFARRDMKTADNYFRGFPALWNVVAFYLFIVAPDPALAALLVGLLAILTFAPIHVVHPFRVRDFGRWLPAIALLWAASTIGLLWPELSASGRTGLLAASAGAAFLLLALGLVRTFRGPA